MVFKLESVLMSVIVKYSYHLTRGLLVKLQWDVYQNKIAEGFLRTTFNSLGKVTNLLDKKSVFLSLLQSLLNLPCLTFAKQDSNLKPGLSRFATTADSEYIFSLQPVI